MFVCMCVCMCVYVCAYIYVCACMYAFAYVHASVYICVCVYVYMCFCVCSLPVSWEGFYLSEPLLHYLSSLLPPKSLKNHVGVNRVSRYLTGLRMHIFDSFRWKSLCNRLENIYPALIRSSASAVCKRPIDNSNCAGQIALFFLFFFTTF